MRILFALLIAVAAIPGCCNKAQVRDIAREVIELEMEGIGNPRIATQEDLKNIQKKMDDRCSQYIRYHSRNFPHGGCDCK